MRMLDLFTGVGGFSLAFKREFPNGEIVGFSEIDKYAIQVYNKHFPTEKNFGDITTIRERELPDFDICTFGFPCQDLSIAGKRKGFDGQRSSLFHEAIRIIDFKRPKYFIFENVKGLFSSRKGEDFIEVLQTITDIGYNGQWQLLNTKWFLPQNRERIYFVGHLREEPRPEIFPIGEKFEVYGTEQQQTERQLGELPCSKRIQKGQEHQYNNDLIQLTENKSQGYRVYSTDGISQTLAGQAGGLGAKTGLYEITTAQPRCGDPKKGGTGELSSTEYSFTIDSQPHIVNKIRRLTPIECERLQGYDDNWTEGISDTQRYKCLGNSITVNVAQEIFKRISDYQSQGNLF